MPDPLRVALLGVGGVGQALLETLTQRDPPIRLVAATDTAGTVSDPDGLDPAALLATKREHGTVTEHPAGSTHPWRAVEAAEHVDADAVVQLTPTELTAPEPALRAIEHALSRGAHVVTAAKDALATQPARLRRAARSADRCLLASAAVGGSTPVLETLEGAFQGDPIDRVEAVLNGSTTFVLARMEQGATREEALAQARAAGLLEADPTVDLAGHDAAAKAALVHQRVFGSSLTVEDVTTTGVGSIQEEACRRARERGFAIRLLARIDRSGATVGPVEIPREGPFALTGPTCVVRVTCEGAGQIVISGPGAGPRETASAVLSDVLSIASGRTAASTPAKARAAASTQASRGL